jgi:Lipoprotein confined to pathogenic Mycobacterium
MRTQPTGGRQRRLCATVVAIALAATGCHVYQPSPHTPPDQSAKAVEQLRALPSLEDTQAQVQAAIDEITAGASAVIPGAVWESAQNADTNTCEPPYDQTEGKTYFLPNRIAENVTVSEQNWTDILRVAKESAAKIGATDVQVMMDQPHNHDVWFSGPSGTFIKISYRDNLVVAGNTGCRLPHDKK